MNITCPQCGFCRPFPPDRAPAHSVIATCPQCACRFRFHPQDGSSEMLAPVPPASAPAHDGQAPGRDPGTPGHGTQAGARQDSAAHDEPSFRHEPPRDEIPPFRPRAAQEDRDGQDDEDREDRQALKDGEPLEDDFRHDDRPERPSGNPWDMAPEPSGWAVAFYRTATRIMFAAPAFFSCLRPHRRSLRALGFYLVVSVILSVVQLLWMRGMTSMLMDGGMDPQMQQMMTSTLGLQESMPLFVLKQVAFVTLQLYGQSALLYLMYRLILRDKPDFDLIFQVSAYGVAPMLLCVIPVLGALTGLVWSLACTLVGYRTVLRLNWGQTLLGYAPVFLLEFFLLLQVMRMV